MLDCIFPISFNILALIITLSDIIVHTEVITVLIVILCSAAPPIAAC